MRLARYFLKKGGVVSEPTFWCEELSGDPQEPVTPLRGFIKEKARKGEYP
jgi:hypothetical protein